MQEETLEDIYFFACTTGNLDKVKECIEKGVDINVYDDEGTPSFLKACMSYNPDLVEYLINNGAQVGLYNYNYNNELYMLTIGERSYEGKVLKYYREKMEKFDPIKIRKARYKILKMLLKQNSSYEFVNQKNPEFSTYVTALHKAASYHDNDDVVKLLLKYNADPEIKNSFGKKISNKMIQDNLAELNRHPSKVKKIKGSY